jgi:hypothetical protein
MKRYFKIMIYCGLVFTVKEAVAGNKSQCAKAVGKTVYYGGRSAIGAGSAALEVSRGGAGNLGIHSAVTNWDKVKKTSKDVKKYCFPSK